MQGTANIDRPRLAVTLGDPSGVGPEILVKALKRKDVLEGCRPVVIGDPLVLLRAADVIGERIDLRVFDKPVDIPEETDRIPVLCPSALTLEDVPFGRPSRAACRAVIEYIDTAVAMVQKGSAAALVTCPIHKANLHRNGFPFPGHTEYLQRLSGGDEMVMMLAGPRLRVSLVTIHHAIAEVPELITRERVARTIRITGDSLLRDFGIAEPCLAVAALNPHAGEEGRFGREDLDIVAPAIEQFRDAPYRVHGPFPSDTVFHRAAAGEFHAVVAMYHDQGLIPVKLLHFEDAVNVTLGLPIVRTSVDHGTAYDIAGTGRASDGSLRAALHLAAEMVRNRRKGG